MPQLYISNLIPAYELEQILHRYSRTGGTDGEIEDGRTGGKTGSYGEIGIEEIQFSISAVLDEIAWKDEIELDQNVRLLGRDRPLSLHGPFLDLCPATFDSRIQAATKARFEQVYEIATHLNADRIVFHTGFIPIVHVEESWIENSIIFWKDFLKDKTGEIEIHLENVQDQNPEPICDVLAALDVPFFTACLDVGHVNRYSSRTIFQWISVMEGRIGHIHLHNNDGAVDAHLAEGTLDLESIIAQIQRIAPQAGMTLEIVEAAALESLLKNVLKCECEGIR